jgi:hypothetical protein
MLSKNVRVGDAPEHLRYEILSNLGYNNNNNNNNNKVK